jgi:hypothetical protein
VSSVSAQGVKQELVFDLLQRYCTVERTQGLLGAHDAPYSAANWRELIAQRVLPALRDGSISIQDLLGLIRDADEHGDQHVFLYRCDTDAASPLLGRPRISQIMNARGLSAAIERPSLVDMPKARRIVEARWDADGAFVLKTVGTRIHSTRVEERREGTRRVIVYDDKPYRAVDLFKLHPDGLLEIRIQSHKNSSQYKNDIKEMWEHAGEVLPHTSFEPISLLNAKNWLWSNRLTLRQKIRFTGMRLRNADDFRLTAAAPTLASDLTSDHGTVDGAEGFLRHSGAYCDQSNCYFINADGPPPKDVHVILAGDMNEFALTASCSREAYNNVLADLRKYNR